MAASSGVATSSQEEILDSALDVEDDLSEEIEEEGDAQDLNPDNLEGTTDEDENNGQVYMWMYVLSSINIRNFSRATANLK